MKIRRNKRSRRRSKRRQRGGKVAIKFDQPEVSETSASSAIKGSIQAQKENNDEMSEINKQMSGGGDVTVPQMDQAGDSGNQSISDGIANILKSFADAEFDIDIDENSTANSDYIGGKRRTKRRKKSRKRRKSRRNTRKRKSRRNTRKRKSRRKTRKRKKTRRRTRRRKGGDKKLTSADVR